jgi:poly(beta-D-mannuronate) lyase
MRMKTGNPLVPACLALALLCFAPRAALALSPSFDVEALRGKLGKADNRPFSCPAPPAPMRDLHMESFYSKENTSSDIVDPAAYKAYKSATKPAAVFESTLASMGNRYVRSNPPRADVASCAASWLDAWAQAGAMLGDVNKNGEYTRGWVLASIASAWLQIRGEPSLDHARRERIEGWMRDVAQAVQSDFSRDADLSSRRNNHLYWAAWAAAATGMALDDDALFRWSMEKARFGIDQIQKDGTLPLELARGRRAFLYHLFAAMPLFMLAEAGAHNGVDLFRENGEGLRRLGALNLDNVPAGAGFEQLSGKTQDLRRVATPSDLGWMEIYRKHYDDPRADAVLKDFRPMKQSRFGGDITLMYAGVDAREAGKKQR